MRQVFLITGFLGSGKTTLALRLIQAQELQNAVLIVNDFGDASFDSIQIGATGINYRSMDGGCICCTVKADLLKTLHEIPQVFPEKNVIWIESSGISDPSELLQVFDSSSFVSDSYALQSVVTVVDGRSCFDWLIRQESAPQQIAVASEIIINTHNDAKKKLKKLFSQIRAFNPLAKVRVMSILNDQPTRINYFQRHEYFPAKDPVLGNLEHKHKFKNHGYLTHAIRWRGDIREEDLIFILDQWIESIGPNLLRLKGIAQIAEKNTSMVIQGVRQRVTFDYAHLDRLFENFLVIIGIGISEDKVRELFNGISSSIGKDKLELDICQK